MRLIDADAMMKRLEEWNTNDSMDKALYNFALIRIIEQPTIDPVWKGHWDKADETPYIRKHFNVVCCSVCRKKGYTAWNYCPNCGAKMEEGEQDG